MQPAGLLASPSSEAISQRMAWETSHCWSSGTAREVLRGQALELGSGRLEVPQLRLVTARATRQARIAGKRSASSAVAAVDLAEPALKPVEQNGLDRAELIDNRLPGPLAPGAGSSEEPLRLAEASVDDRPHPAQQRHPPEVLGLPQAPRRAARRRSARDPQRRCLRARGGRAAPARASAAQSPDRRLAGELDGPRGSSPSGSSGVRALSTKVVLRLRTWARVPSSPRRRAIAIASCVSVADRPCGSVQ